MITSSDSLKAKLKNLAKEINISQEALRKMVMFERLLMRVSLSKYKENFILKGGFLIAAYLILICEVQLMLIRLLKECH